MLKLWSEFSDFLKKCKYFLNFIQGDHLLSSEHFITVRVCSTMGRYCFHRCLSAHTPSPSHNTSTGPMSFVGGDPSDWSQVPSWGIQDRGYPPGQGWGTPRDRTADLVLDSRRAVCLLRSRRRTFLFILFLDSVCIHSVCVDKKRRREVDIRYFVWKHFQPPINTCKLLRIKFEN